MKIRALSRTHQLVVAVVIGLAVLVAGAKIYTVRNAYDAAIARAEHETQNAVAILTEHAARTFDGVSRALDAAVDLRAEIDAGHVMRHSQIHDALKTIQGGSPVILAIGWSDADGNRVASSLFRDPPPLNIADQDQFRVLRDDSSTRLYISAPIRSRLDGTWVIPVSRRIQDSDGRFAGIVNAVLRLDYFLDFYRAINLGPDATVLLVRSDATLLARMPSAPELLGRTLPVAVVTAAMDAGYGSGSNGPHSVKGMDGKERVFAYDAIVGFPLMIGASMSKHDALAHYRETLFAAAIEGALMLAALAGGGVLLFVVVRRRVADARQLADTSELLHSVFAVTNQAIVVFDRERRCVAWNDLCLAYFAKGLELGKGAPLHAMLRRLAEAGEYGEREVDAYVNERLDAARMGRPVRYERERPSGQVLEVNWLPLPNGYLVISHTDITHLKKAERDLRESEALAARTLARLKDAVDSLSDPFFLWDADERLVLANSAAAAGPGSDLLVPGVRLEDILIGQARVGRFTAAIGREEEYVAERLAQIRRADGEIREVERADGRWLATTDRRTHEGGIVSLRVDITELKKIEIALRESEARAAQATFRLADAIDSLPNPLMLWDAEERLVLFNQAASEVLSLNAEGDAEALRPGISLEEAVRRFVGAGRVPAAIGREEEYIQERLAQARRGDGERIEVQLADGRWLAMRDRRTRDGGIVSLRADLAEAKAREAELAVARQAADAASRAKSDFLSRMSHELRTPLNAVIGFAQMLQIDPAGGMTDRQRSYCRDIEFGGRHLLALVNDVLDLARIESGKDRISVARVTAAEALDSLDHATRSLAEGAGIVLRIAAAEDVPDLRADEMRLRQILLNLVSNAIKYNRAGGRVDVTAAERPDGVVRFAVTDTGMGIAEDQQKELFQPFHRLGQEYSGIDGTGIGLAISRRLAEAMGGSVGFSSAVGVGSTFWVDLPIDRSEPEDAAATETISVISSFKIPPRTSGFSILYVEDNPSNMRLMEHLVSILPGVDLLPASTPRLGLDLARAHRPDVILLDLHLPGMDGYEMLARLKAMPETRETPVIALTAAAMPNDIRRGLAAGFFRYLTKPIDVKEFLSAIGECIPLDGEEAEEEQQQVAD